MFSCKEELSKEQLERIKRIIYTDDFKRINSFITICDLNQDEDKIIKNIKDYIWSFLAYNNKSIFPLKVNDFISFIENYSKIKKPEFTFASHDGIIPDLRSDFLVTCNGYHINNDFSYMHRGRVNGLYMGESYLGTDHKIYLSKKSMRSRSLPVSDDIAMEVDYNSLIAESVFHYFSQPVANYYLVRNNHNPYNSILTPNFLEDNQELIHLSDLINEDNEDYLDTHSNRLKIIKEELERRYKKDMPDGEFQKMIDRIQLQYCIQSFLKLLIGPMDANLGNTAIILTHNNTSVPYIDMAPAYDLDISFNVASKLVNSNNISQIKDVNGNPSTIMSLIKEFRDIPGFKEFLDEFIKKKLNHDISRKILDDVKRRTNLVFFKEREESYTRFLNIRLIEVLDAYKKVYLVEDINEIILGRL